MAVTRNSDAVTPVRSSGAFSIWLTRHASTSVARFGPLVATTFCQPDDCPRYCRHARPAGGDQRHRQERTVASAQLG